MLTGLICIDIDMGIRTFGHLDIWIFGYMAGSTEAIEAIEAIQAIEAILLMNHHNSETECKNIPRLIILRCVFEGPSRIHLYLMSKMLTRSRQRAAPGFKAP